MAERLERWVSSRQKFGIGPHLARRSEIEICDPKMQSSG